MTETADPQRWAVSLVAPEMTATDDVEVIEALLEHAAGGAVAPRHLSKQQIEQLSEHRVVSLIPTDWTTDELPALVRQRKIIVGVQVSLEMIATNVVQSLATAGIECRVLKGLATAALDYHDPDLRHSGDVDVLVRRPDLERAMALAGGTPTEASPHEIRFLTGPTLVLGSGFEVDMHYRLSRFGVSASDVLFADPTPLPALGAAAYAMPAELRLVHAAIHLVFSRYGRRRLSGLADISAIRAHNTIDMDKARELARLIGVERIAGFGLRLERLASRKTDDLADWPVPNRLEHAAYGRTHASVPMEHLLDFMTLSGAREHLRYLAYRAGTAFGRARSAMPAGLANPLSNDAVDRQDQPA